MLETTEPKKKAKKNIFVLVLSLLTLLSLLTTGYLIYQMKVTPKTEEQKLVQEVSKVMVLPDETPVIATIEDIEKVKDQPFFESAQNGDKVLAFVQHKKAILYRPSTKMIIDVGPIVLTYGEGTTTTE